jgi:hypothetical protein
MAPRSGYFPPALRTTDLHRSSTAFTQSGSASPATQYSPYSQTASIASGYDGHHYTRGSSSMHESRNLASSSEPERNMIAMAPTGQSSIQMMTIKSQHGHPVQIPVDVQAASKGADEKRKRNAGASARFRARRKEKEREASMCISRLEQQVRDAIDSVEFYRKERDYFRSIVYQQPGAERYHPRAASPQLMRLSAVPSQAASSVNDGGSDGSFGDYDDDTRDSERNVRRRTSYHPASGASPTDSVPPRLPLHEYRSSPFPPSSSSAMNHMTAHAAPYSPGVCEPVYRDPLAPDARRYAERH